MSKPVKDLITETIRAQYAGIGDVCVVDLTGLDVGRTQRLRRDLRGKSMRMQVIKNSLARRAFAGGPLEPIAKVLNGPCALVVGGDSIIDVAKTLVHWATELGDINVKEAMLDGDPNLMTVAQLSEMKGHQELMSDLADLIGSPGRALAGCIGGPAGRIAGCLKTLADREEAA
ncbi:MAG: 50S ribosomal protein L10 [Planctomycetes bacterium]|nr:50S ribosomal protein L10 [Planctomycetota bacterium]